MLRVDGVSGRISDHFFVQFPDFVEPGDVVVINDTRVIKARLIGAKPSGGRVEALVERILDPHLALAMLRTSHVPLVAPSELLSASAEVCCAVPAVAVGRDIGTASKNDSVCAKLVFADDTSTLRIGGVDLYGCAAGRLAVRPHLCAR